MYDRGGRVLRVARCALHLHCSRAGNANCLYYGDDELKEEYEEENHKVKGRIGPECFVRRAEPAQVRERRK